MKILGGHLSPFVMRAALVARLKGVDIPVEMPADGIKTQAYLAMNPMGKMPTLVDGDFALPESAVIAEYLDEVLDGPRLLPEEPKARARDRLLARVADLYIVPNLVPIFRARENPGAVPAAIEGMREALGHIEALRPAGAQWLAADRPGLSDAAVMPLLFFLDSFDSAFGTGKLVAERPGLAAWWAKAKASPEGERMMREMAAGLAAFMTTKN